MTSTVLTIRWRAVFEPICWIVGHRWQFVEAGTWADRSGYSCLRCRRWRARWIDREAPEEVIGEVLFVGALIYGLIVTAVIWVIWFL